MYLSQYRNIIYIILLLYINIFIILFILSIGLYVCYLMLYIISERTLLLLLYSVLPHAVLLM